MTFDEPRPAHAPTQAQPTRTGPCRLRDLAYAAVGALVPSAAEEHSPELTYLTGFTRRIRTTDQAWDDALEHALARPHTADAQLVNLANELGLAPVELLTIALAASAEEDAIAGRAFARLQAPIAGSRPILSLAAQAFARTVDPQVPPLTQLINGPAVRLGLLVVSSGSSPIAERALAVPLPLCLAFSGQTGNWPGVTVGIEESVTLATTAQDEALRHASAIAPMDRGGLLIRTGSPAEGRAAAAAIARSLDLRPALIETEPPPGLGPWLGLLRLLPVFVCQLAPSERKQLPTIPGYRGPRLALSGPDGAVDTADGPLATWRVASPTGPERELLWRLALGEVAGNRPLAHEMAMNHRHGAARISQLGRLAAHEASLAGHPQVTRDDIAHASWSGEAEGLESLAEPVRQHVEDNALVVPDLLRNDLGLLLLRCRERDTLVSDLGTAARVRYRAGVRALFTGASGTGKTLAACWLASRLGIPLYRVDLASVTSKYIGETEKNLAQLLARAEQAEVVLLFDEADSLFGKRTDIRDSNDRFANAQTNYLLQRIEGYDGIVVLTSNSKARFDAAFARRLDCVLEFPLPAADERRALWTAHLGTTHGLAPGELNQLAALADVAGGHIRNAVLTAALLARERQRPIRLHDCARGLEAEYRKLGRSLPAELKTIAPPPPP